MACPITDAAARRKLHDILDACLSDNVKARQLLPDGSYVNLPRPGEPFDCQERLMAEAIENAPSAPIPHRAMSFLSRIFHHGEGRQKKSAGPQWTGLFHTAMSVISVG